MGRESKAVSYDVYVLNKNIAAGDVITADDITVGKTNDSIIAAITVYKQEQLEGKVANRSLSQGNYIFLTDLHTANAIELESIPSGKEIVAVSVKDIAMDVAYQVKAGDIIRIYSLNKDGEAEIAEELMYVEVEDVYNSVGQRISELVDSDADYVPAAVSVIVNSQQAQKIVTIEQKSTAFFSLISRGSIENKEKYLNEQNAKLKELAEKADKENEKN